MAPAAGSAPDAPSHTAPSSILCKPPSRQHYHAGRLQKAHAVEGAADWLNVKGKPGGMWGGGGGTCSIKFDWLNMCSRATAFWTRASRSADAAASSLIAASVRENLASSCFVDSCSQSSKFWSDQAPARLPRIVSLQSPSDPAMSTIATQQNSSFRTLFTRFHTQILKTPSFREPCTLISNPMCPRPFNGPRAVEIGRFAPCGALAPQNPSSCLPRTPSSPAQWPAR